MPSWCPLPTARPLRRVKLVAHRHAHNGAEEGIDIYEVTERLDLAPVAVDGRAQRPTTIPALASLGAGSIHAAAIGAHADHLMLANAFVVLAVAQLGSGIALLVHPGRTLAKAVVVVNVAAVVGWMVSRLVGVWFIAGLEIAESPEFADTVCALLGALAAAGAALAVQVDNRLGPSRTWRPATTVRDLAIPAIAVALLTVPAMGLAATHSHETHAVDSHSHDEGVDEDETVDGVAAVEVEDE